MNKEDINAKRNLDIIMLAQKLFVKHFKYDLSCQDYYDYAETFIDYGLENYPIETDTLLNYIE